MKNPLQKYILLFLFVNFFWFTANAQNTQVIRGKVIDKITQTPLPGAHVFIPGTQPIIGTGTNVDGRFRLENVPLGRHDVKITFLGYKEVVVPNVNVGATREIVLEVEMEESVYSTEEVVVTGKTRKDKPLNEMAPVSARMFTTEETQRYAGALGDPSRMVQGFAGVSGANDARNDIIIRGNSPWGLLWRLDGVDVPNPNHFAAQGSTGGPVSMLNNNLLTNSDFITGAFPAEYGNAFSGVFDLKLRSGNNEKYLYTGQIGFNGFELMAEGPISRSAGSSFLASYRYSVLGFFEAVGINLGPSGTPKYQDISFKVVLPTEKAGRWEIFGLGGISSIKLLDSERGEDDFTYGQQRRDVYFGSGLGVLSVTNIYPMKKGYIRTSLYTTNERVTTDVDTLDGQNNISPFYRERADYNRVAIHSFYSHKFNSKNNIRTGIIQTWMMYTLNQEVNLGNPPAWRTLTDADGNTHQSQAYGQWQHKISDSLSLLMGLHTQYFFLNGSYAAEPRAGVKWNFSPRNTLSFGYGLHAKHHPLPLVFFEKFDPVTGNTSRTNTDLDFMRSHHFVAGFDRLLGKDLRLKTELYYQYLFDVPVTPVEPAFSVVNMGADFNVVLEPDLVNEGSGRNYGFEVTFEKFFSRNYYFLVTASIFDSKYRGYDGVLRNTAFNSHYIFNALGGKDWKLGKNTLSFSTRATYGGGRRYTPFQVVDSVAVYRHDMAYSEQYPNYFKIDARLGYKIEKQKFSQEWALDVQNVTNNRNVLTHYWDEQLHEIRYEYQLAIFPMVLYRVQF